MARANCQSLDRPDIAYAANKCCRRMAAPTPGADQVHMQRLAIYLLAKPRMVYVYDWKEQVGQLDIHTDTDFVGCLITPKSTAGGAAQLAFSLQPGAVGIILCAQMFLLLLSVSILPKRKEAIVISSSMSIISTAVSPAAAAAYAL